MNWTREQQRAIDEREKNILVAAAAGSGKTAVLVERIKKLVIEDGVSIDRMLIVTFTNAAAAEMKEKIRVAINQEIDADPANSQNLRQQLNLLPRANISTFHAFALDVIRTFFFLTDIEPGFAICDDAQRTIIKEDSMDQLMEQCFASDAKEFYDFLNWYSSDRNQNKIRDIINTSYNVLQSLPYPWQWLKEKNRGTLSSAGSVPAVTSYELYLGLYRRCSGEGRTI
ncbi:UvrD-helicase domain-containing protein [Emergencia timonensis]|uniref:UvrD-helicase domain-containing protein n=1 Tax=Emergencia timonensis TaxID=1776384 RepID=UPI00295AE71B|nr:UvrD-helicase domain-containing protein [Emergencia timonensis]WNX89836.1 UvrD-helicase domain-containing protein [Emergencia timonensis]